MQLSAICSRAVCAAMCGRQKELAECEENGEEEPKRRGVAAALAGAADELHSARPRICHSVFAADEFFMPDVAVSHRMRRSVREDGSHANLAEIKKRSRYVTRCSVRFARAKTLMLSVICCSGPRSLVVAAFADRERLLTRHACVLQPTCSITSLEQTVSAQTLGLAAVVNLVSRCSSLAANMQSNVIRADGICPDVGARGGVEEAFCCSLHAV